MSLFPYLCKRGSEVCIQERSMANGRGGVAVEPMPIPCRRVAVLSGAVEGDPEPRPLKGGEKTIKGFDHMYSSKLDTWVEVLKFSCLLTCRCRLRSFSAAETVAASSLDGERSTNIVTFRWFASYFIVPLCPSPYHKEQGLQVGTPNSELGSRNRKWRSAKPSPRYFNIRRRFAR